MTRFSSLLPLAAFLVLAIAPASASAECTANDTAATELAKVGDRVRSTNIDEAIAQYLEAHRLSPTNARITYKLATAYLKKEDWDALQRLSATSCAKNDARCVFLGGYALARIASHGGSATWTDARLKLEIALAVDPALVDAHVELGDVALHLQDEQGALAHYTAAIRLRPDDRQIYAMLADVYARLHYTDQATRVIEQGLTWGESFALRSLAGQIKDERGDQRGALEQYVLAQKACGTCNEPGEAIAFFNVGAAFAQVTPPEKTQAIDNLRSFFTHVCKGAAASRYQDQCMQSQELARRLGASL
jgi:tetratricopeptide (TPR) repeat protein